MKLSYKAITPGGKIIQGLLEAKNIEEAVSYLRGKELLPITVKEGSKQSLPFDFLLHRSTSSDVVLFTRQLSSMLTAGLTLTQSLGTLKEQVGTPAMKEVVEGILSDVQEGKSFGDSISRFPVFSPIYVALVKAAESSGFLDKILLRLADNLEKQQKLKGTIRSALMYPAVIVTLMVVVVGIMMVFVVPQLTVLYQNLNVPLPFTTLVVVGLSSFVIAFWPFIIGMTVLLVFVYRRWSKTEAGGLITDKIKLKIPIFGKLIQQTILAEFSRTFGLLVGAGSLVVESLTQSASVTGNRIYQQAIMEISRRVEKGISIGDAMAAYPIFPPMLVEMVKIGEQTGKVDDALLRVSEYFEREVDQTVKTLTTAMEPIIMIVLGVMVAFLILSIITPIYNLTSNIQ